jgi:Flp pilus assembly pilin Flp
MTTKSILRMFGLITLIALAFLGMNTVLSAEITEIWKKC